MRFIDAECINIPTAIMHNINGCWMIRVEDVQRIITEQPTAFDQEKVIEELDKCKQIMLSPASKDCFGEECRENDCMACVFNKAIEIVEKGGV